MDEAFGKLKGLVDIVIIDSPPFVLADASLLASKADGVLVVIRPAHTQELAARTVLEQLKRVGANVVGIVFNRLSRGSTRYLVGRWTGDRPYIPPAKAASGDGFSRSGLAGVLNRWKLRPSVREKTGEYGRVQTERQRVEEMWREIPEQAFEVDLEDSGLSTRVVNLLRESEYKTVGEVLEQLSVDEKQLLQIPGFTPSIVDDLKERLHTLLYLRSET